MRARRTAIRPIATFLRRLGVGALVLVLAIALAASPAVSAPSRNTPARAKGAKSGAKAGPKTRARSAARTVAKRKPLLTPRASLRRTAEAAPEMPALPAVPTVDLAMFASIDGAAAAAMPAGAPVADAPAEPAKPFAAFSRSATSMLDALTERARSQLGTRYVLGAASPGGALDCSSFTRFAMEALGLQLPRTAAQQAKVGVAVPRDRERLRPGDLLTFGSRRKVSHVGIYLGEGRFIHASVTSGQVIETTFARNAKLLRRWLGARRLFAGADSASTTGG